jgi:hypothetical protein
MVSDMDTVGCSRLVNLPKKQIRLIIFGESTHFEQPQEIIVLAMDIA